MKIFRSFLTSFSRVYVFSNRINFFIKSNASGLRTLFFQFALHIHEAEVHTNTAIFFENFSHLPLFAIFASPHFLLQLHLRREYETSLRCEKVIEQNDTGTTQIIGYAFTFIIYANA